MYPIFSNGKNIIYFLVLFNISCTPEIINSDDFDFSSTGNNIELVVEGAVYSMKGKQYVRLTNPITINNISLLPVNNANVFVNDGINYFYYYNIDSTGLYESVDTFSGIVGKKYTINIEYNNKTYTASDSIVECNLNQIYLPITDIRFSNGKYGIEMPQHNFGYDNPIKLTWGKKTYPEDLEKYSFDLNTQNIYNTSSWDFIMCHIGNPVNGVFNSERVNQSIWASPEDEIIIYYLSISDEYYEFLIDLFEETDWSIGLFSSIPGNIYTNISEGGAGYFYASDIKSKKYMVNDIVNSN